MIDQTTLKKHNFTIDTDQERATLTLTGDGSIKLLVESDGHLQINWDGLTCQLNTEEFDNDNIISALKTLFEGQNTVPPF